MNYEESKSISRKNMQKFISEDIINNYPLLTFDHATHVVDDYIGIWRKKEHFNFIIRIYVHRTYRTVIHIL